jgi:cysteine desulfurase
MSKWVNAGQIICNPTYTHPHMHASTHSRINTFTLKMSNRIYFDHAATTPIAPEVIEKMAQSMREVYGNPSSIHAEGRLARTLIEEARKIVADYLSASLGEVFFTSCGTESNNMVLKGAVRDLGVKRIISSPTEHHCILHALDSLQKDAQTAIEYLPVDGAGRIDLEALETRLGEDNGKTLVSLMHTNNEIGTLVDLEKVSQICEEYGALFHSDTVQTIGYYPFDLSKLKIHFLSGSAHKFYGPKGAGFVYINGDNQLRPFIDGGSQERNMRAGTENLYGIAGLGKALQLAAEDLENRARHTREIRDYFQDRLLEEVEDVQIITPEDSHYKVLSVSFPPSPKAEMLLLNLDISGISASGGSACSSGAEQASHVLEAIKADPDRKVARFSFSHTNTKEEVDIVVKKIKTMLP